MDNCNSNSMCNNRTNNFKHKEMKMYSMGQAVNDLKNFYNLEEFEQVNLNITDINKPFIKFKSNGEVWILLLRRDRRKK